MKVEKLKVDVKYLQEALKKVEANLILMRKRKKETKERVEEHIREAKRHTVTEYKASFTFAKEKAQVVGAFKTS